MPAAVSAMTALACAAVIASQTGHFQLLVPSWLIVWRDPLFYCRACRYLCLSQKKRYSHTAWYPPTCYSAIPTVTLGLCSGLVDVGQDQFRALIPFGFDQMGFHSHLLERLLQITPFLFRQPSSISFAPYYHKSHFTSDSKW